MVKGKAKGKVHPMTEYEGPGTRGTVLTSQTALRPGMTWHLLHGMLGGHQRRFETVVKIPTSPEFDPRPSSP